MSAPGLIASAQAHALLKEVQQQTRDECEALTAAAQAASQKHLAEARGAARRLVSEAIAGLRREGAYRLMRARAQAETQARKRRQHRAGEIVARGRPLLEAALAARWQDAAARAGWTAAAATIARTAIPAGPWRIAHPADWPEAEREALRRAFDDAVQFEADDVLSAGLRIHAGGATLDATVQGLLADRDAAMALLLAELDAAEPDDGGGP